MPPPSVRARRIRHSCQCRSLGATALGIGKEGKCVCVCADWALATVFRNGNPDANEFVSTGSVWARNPIPRNDWWQTGKGFAPPCADARRCSGMMDGDSADDTLEIVDRVRIPADLPPGDYVLGWRWDCEESNQIWQSCSDVRIVA